MTGPNTTPITPLSEKLSLVTHHHRLMRVSDKLDLDDWNYESWAYFFEQLCSSYDVEKYLHTPTTESTLSSSAPLTPEELKVDKIVLSWILFTFSDSLRARLVVARPKSAKEAWGLISDIVKDNKRSRTNTLKAELRSIKLGDQSMESYFQKIDSIVNILASLDARVNDEDVVHYVLEGLPDTYNHVCGYMHWKDTFPDLKTVRSLLIIEEMRLKSRTSTLLADYSSPMVLVSESGNTRRSSSTPQVKSWRTCFNFAKGNYRFGATCRYLHDANARIVGDTGGVNKNRGNNDTNELLAKLLAQLGNLGVNGFVSPNENITSPPVAFHAGPSPSLSPTVAQFNTLHPAPTASAHHVLTTTGPNHSAMAYQPQPVSYSVVGQAHPPQTVATCLNTLGYAIVFPHAFTVRTLQDPSTGAWNMDTGSSSHLNNYVTSLSIMLNSCMYSSVSVGDDHSIPVTNTGHSILPTPSKYLRLNNVLITPHIVKNLISVRQFVRDNDCTIEFDSFGFSVKDFMTRRVLLQRDSIGDLYLVTAPSPISHAFLVSQHTWHQRLGHPGSDVLRRLVSNNVISCNKEKPPVLCHACQLGKHVRLPFVYPLVRKSDVLCKFILFRNYVHTQFKCEIRAFQCDHGGEFDNRNLHDLFNTHGIQFRFSCPKTSQQNDNDCTIEFDTFGFSVKDFMTRWVLLRYDSIGDLYLVTAPSPISHAFLVSQYMWHQRLGHPGSDVLRRLVSNNVI
ncbi:ribonuclease H-like domain-containing protein [Tanacetum coccineum]